MPVSFAEKTLTAEIDLNNIKVPFDENAEIPEKFTVRLGETYTISNPSIDLLNEYEGFRYNAIEFRVPLLSDALRHQNIADDEVLFWREIAFDCALSLKLEEGDSVEYVPDGYIRKRGKQLFSKDWSTRTLRAIRDFLQTGLPTVKFYYEGECPCPRKRIIPYFTEVSNFFS